MQELICYISTFFSGTLLGFLGGALYASRTKKQGLPSVKNRPRIKDKHDH